MSMLIINEDHYVPSVTYDAGQHTFTKEKIGTRYVAVGVRTLVDPADPKDMQQVHALQDGSRSSQTGARANSKCRIGTRPARRRCATRCWCLRTTLPDFKKAFGTKEQVDPVRHLIGTAAAWGGNPDKDAIYLNITPTKNDGKTVYKLNVKDVPVDGFWSVSLYNAEGYLREEPVQRLFAQQHHGARRTRTARSRSSSAAATARSPNCLPIMKGWNYTVRLYRPRAEILNGKWKFPEPQPAS